jgi:hypothetical protein
VLPNIEEDDSVYALFFKFIGAAIEMIKFIKVNVNGISEDQFKTPYKKPKEKLTGSPLVRMH